MSGTKNKDILLTQRQETIINGHLLGDGGMHLNISGTGYLSIGRAGRDIEYSKWTAKELENILIPSCLPDKLKIRDVHDTRTQKTYQTVVIRSKCLPSITELYHKWYKDGKKIVPGDLVLCPLSIAVWFADDGSVSSRHGRKGTKAENKFYPHRLTSKFATHSFSLTEVKFLVLQLEKLVGVKIHFYKEKDVEQYTIRFNGSSVSKKLFRMIDRDFPDGIDRKSIRWRRKEADLYEQLKIRPSCPHCSHAKVYKNGHDDNGKQKYQCLKCKRQFLDLENYEQKRQPRRPNKRKI